MVHIIAMISSYIWEGVWNWAAYVVDAELSKDVDFDINPWSYFAAIHIFLLMHEGSGFCLMEGSG